MSEGCGCRAAAAAQEADTDDAPGPAPPWPDLPPAALQALRRVTDSLTAVVGVAGQVIWRSIEATTSTAFDDVQQMSVSAFTAAVVFT